MSFDDERGESEISLEVDIGSLLIFYFVLLLTLGLFYDL